MANKHMKSSNIILMVVIVFVVMMGTGFYSLCHANDTEVLREEKTQEYESVEVTTKDPNELKQLMADCESTMKTANIMAESARTLGYDEGHIIIALAKEDYGRAQKEYEAYYAVYDDIMKVWEERAVEYPAATQAWLYLYNLGYSDSVIAGIIGNMMVECGGHTLALNPTIYSKDGYYGLCQWNKNYGIHGTSIEVQLDYLANSIEETFDNFGYLYQRGFDYSSFMSLTSEKEAALAFARVYERCTMFSYGARRACATTAYNYFVK